MKTIFLISLLILSCLAHAEVVPSTQLEIGSNLSKLLKQMSPKDQEYFKRGIYGALTTASEEGKNISKKEYLDLLQVAKKYHASLDGDEKIIKQIVKQNQKIQDEHFNEVQRILGKMTGDRRDAFYSQFMATQKLDSEDGADLSESEYKRMIELSKLNNIPIYKDVDSQGRPPIDERRNEIQAICETFKGQSYKTCEAEWFRIVDHTSDNGDDVTDSEWDEFQEVVKKLKSK